MHPFCEINCPDMYTRTEHRFGIHSSVLKLVKYFYKCRLILADELHCLHNVDQGYTRTPVWRFISVCMRTVFCSLFLSPHWSIIYNKTHPSFS